MGNWGKIRAEANGVARTAQKREVYPNLPPPEGYTPEKQSARRRDMMDDETWIVIAVFASMVIVAVTYLIVGGC